MTWDKDAVKQLRQSLELTQNEFAELLGCRQQTISEWEQGLYAPANAYGKLLSQLKVKTPHFSRVSYSRQQEDVLPVPVSGENEYDRPFDPAID